MRSRIHPTDAEKAAKRAAFKAWAARPENAKLLAEHRERMAANRALAALIRAKKEVR